jgi:N-acetylglutamate synthase-like GNAT family acetyltransferase
MNYQILFASNNDEPILREILIDCDMDLAGDIQEHVLIKKDNEILGGGMLAQTGKDIFHLLVFAVRQNARSKGIGSQLLQELVKQPWIYCSEGFGIADSEYRVTTVAKGKSTNFYRKSGFIACDFSALAYPFNEQCDACPDRIDCNPVAMLFTGYRKNGE